MPTSRNVFASHQQGNQTISDQRGEAICFYHSRVPHQSANASCIIVVTDPSSHKQIASPPIACTHYEVRYGGSQRRRGRRLLRRDSLWRFATTTRPAFAEHYAISSGGSQRRHGSPLLSITRFIPAVRKADASATYYSSVIKPALKIPRTGYASPGNLL